MATRNGTALRVRLYNKGCRYQAQYWGTAVKCKAPEMYKQKRWACDTFDSAGLSLVDVDPERAGTLPTIAFVELPGENGGFASAPYLDASQEIGTDWWTTQNGSWEELDDPDYDGKVVFNKDATEQVTVTATSKFQLPINAHIVLSLWRGEPTKDHDRLTYPAHTSIGFGQGGTQYKLVMPYGGQAAYLAAYDTLNSRWTRIEAEGGGELPSFEGIARGQRFYVVIATWKHRLCIGFGRGKGSEVRFTTFPLPAEWRQVTTAGQQETRDVTKVTRQGPLRIEHNAGQVAFRWWPIYHYPSTNTLYWNGNADPGYNIWAAEIPGAAQLSSANCDKWRQIIWREGLGGGLVAMWASDPTITPYEVNDADHLFSWKATWTPTRWALRSNGQVYEGTPSGGELSYYQSPMVFGVQVRGAPYVLDRSSWPDYTDVTSDVAELSVESSEGNAVTRLGLRLTNEAGALRTAANYQMITVELGYTWTDERDDLSDHIVFAGYLIRPGQGAKVGPVQECDWIAFCPMTRLRDEKSNGMVPDFQKFSPKAAIECLAQAAGFHANQLALLGTTDAMYLGEPGYDDSETYGISEAKNDSLLPAYGTELIRACEEYARKDNESLLYLSFDATEKWILHKTNGQDFSGIDTLYTLYEDATDEQHHVYEIETTNVGMDSSQYADVVTVRGHDVDGGVVQGSMGSPSRLTDPTDANWGGGWRHAAMEQRDHVQTKADAQQRAIEILEKRRRTARVATVTGDLVWNMTKIDRFKVSRNAGSTGKAYNAGILNTEFRVLSWGIHATRESLARMTLTGRTL